MTVKELINELEKCNPDDIVMYDPSNAIKNENDNIDAVYGIDDVLIGSGTIRGFVFLAEELL